MKNFCSIIILFFPALCGAQQNKIVMAFTDAGKMTSLKDVTILNSKGSVVTRTDSSGHAIINPDAFSSAPLIVICPGYKPDTISAPAGTIYLRPLTVTLDETIVTDRKVVRLSAFNNDYIADYEFVDDNILVAGYSGNNGGHAKLFLLDGHGKALSTCKIAEEPLSLFKSCVGKCYYIACNHFYPINISGNSLSVSAPHPIKLLPGLRQCEASVAGNYYYRLANRANFTVTYGMIAKNDSVFMPFETFEERDVAAASYQELIEIIALWNSGQAGNMKEAARTKLLRDKWDRGSFAHINMPLLNYGDTLLIFDFFKRQLKYYSLSGKPAGNIPISFPWKQSQQFEILKDDIANKFYIHRYENKQRQTIEQLDINSGATYNKFVVEKPFAEQVKIHDGLVYFLWQNTPSTPRQLYNQKMADNDVAVTTSK